MGYSAHAKILGHESEWPLVTRYWISKLQASWIQSHPLQPPNLELCNRCTCKEVTAPGSCSLFLVLFNHKKICLLRQDVKSSFLSPPRATVSLFSRLYKCWYLLSLPSFLGLTAPLITLKNLSTAKHCLPQQRMEEAHGQYSWLTSFLATPRRLWMHSWNLGRRLGRRYVRRCRPFWAAVNQPWGTTNQLRPKCSSARWDLFMQKGNGQALPASPMADHKTKYAHIRSPVSVICSFLVSRDLLGRLGKNMR